VKVNQVFFSVSSPIFDWHNMVGMQLFSIKQVFYSNLFSIDRSQSAKESLVLGFSATSYPLISYVALTQPYL
jgi:hypothetical protein